MKYEISILECDYCNKKMDEDKENIYLLMLGKRYKMNQILEMYLCEICASEIQNIIECLNS